MVEADETKAERPRILIIDDDEDTQEFLSFALQSKGFLIDQAFNSEEALKKARQRRFAVILCDIELPSRSGLDILPDLRRIAAGTPVILISGAAPAHAAIAGVVEGAAAFITKPIDAQDLYWLIVRTMGSEPKEPSRSP